MMKTSDYAAMTLNERLFVADLMDEFDGALATRDHDALVAILRKVAVERPDAIARSIVASV